MYYSLTVPLWAKKEVNPRVFPAALRTRPAGPLNTVSLSPSSSHKSLNRSSSSGLSPPILSSSLVRPSLCVRLLGDDYSVPVLSQSPVADTPFLPALLARYSSLSAASTRFSSVLVELLGTATPTEIVTGRNSEGSRPGVQ